MSCLAVAEPLIGLQAFGRKCHTWSWCKDTLMKASQSQQLQLRLAQTNYQSIFMSDSSRKVFRSGKRLAAVLPRSDFSLQPCYRAAGTGRGRRLRPPWQDKE